MSIAQPAKVGLARSDTSQPEGKRQSIPSYSLFPTTKWDLIRTLQADADSKATQIAYDLLCSDYWQPVYTYLRNQFEHHEAEDVAQEFFLRRAVRTNVFLIASEQRGKLRNLILQSLRWHVDTYLRLHAYSQRRGGQAVHVSTDYLDTKVLPSSEPEQGNEIDLAWAKELHELLMTTLREEHIKGGRRELFEVLSHRTATDTRECYKRDAETLGISPDAARVIVFRMRKRYEALREQLIIMLGAQA